VGSHLGAWILALAIAGCSNDEVPVPGAATTLGWEPCGADLECASLPVPRDHDAPDGPLIRIALARRLANDASRRIGSLLVNPGGPGGSGVLMASYAALFLPEELLDRFDVVGFDPRGAGKSTPAVDCTDDLDSYVALDLTPDDADERAALVSENEKLAAECETRSGPLLPFIDTSQVVRDMDLIREAVGDARLTYLGYSYGTFLGALYADRFPDRVRALVLDGAVDPGRDGEQLVRGQALGFEQSLEAFFAWCAADPGCAFHGGGDPAPAFDTLMADLDASPLAVHGRTLGPGESWWAVTDALYRPEDWKGLAEALELAEQGDGSALLQLSDGAVGRSKDGTYANFLEQYLAISSIETPYPASLAAFDALASDVAKEAPRLGPALVYNTLLPLYWPVPPQRTAAPVRAAGAAPILVIGTVGDPATPYAWAEALAKELESGVLLTYEGQGHTAFAHDIACIDEPVVDYLISLEAPEPDTRCAAIAPP